MNIVFYYPSRIIGGAEFLFLNMANRLSVQTTHKIFYVDFKDGFPRSQIKESVEIIDYNKDSPTRIPADSVVVMQLNQINNLNKIIICEGDYKPFFWGINPGNLVDKIRIHGCYIVSKRFRRKCGVLLKQLVDNGIIGFMDEVNVESLKQAFFINEIKTHYLPVPIDEKRIKKNFIPKQLNNNLISFAWLGRLDSDKIPTLETFMNELEYFSKQQAISLSIIGGGTQLSYLNKIISKYHYKINLKGPLIGEELDNFIDSKVDVGLAMGTSILEFSKRGIPVIIMGLMNKAQKAGVINDYLLTSEIKGFSLGSIDGIKMLNDRGASFLNKTRQLMCDYPNISQDCFNYVVHAHTIEHTTILLQNAIENIPNNVERDVIESLSYMFDSLTVRSIIVRAFFRFFRCFHF